MSLAYVQAVVAGVTALILSWSALMTATALALPAQTGKAERSLEESPKRCFWRGLGMLLVFFIGLRLTQIPSPPTLFLGLLVMLSVGAVLTVGAAGIAQLMGRRIGEMTGATTSFGSMVRGGLVFSLALLFPLIGWYIFLPLAALFSLGAGVQALWPKRTRRTVSVPPLPSQPDLQAAN